jgi:ubiquinol-cytochrome c reductase cytochrome c1 subunit
MRRLILAAAFAAVAGGTPAVAAEAPELPKYAWTFDSPFSAFDQGVLRRGFRVYNQVCASCHSLSLLAYRHLAGAGFNGTEIREIASQYEVEDGPDEDGDMFFRPARPSDYFVPPFPNDQAARVANGGTLPLDLSLIVRARPGGADYLMALLVGYSDEPPAGVELREGMYYNAYFPGRQIAMPPPLYPDSVDYEDGTSATVEQMASDVATFLTWASMPKMQTRKRIGVMAMIFLVVFTGLMFVSMRRIWSDNKG